MTRASRVPEHIADLRDWNSTRAEAERRYNEAVRAAFPIGANIHSGTSGRGIVACTVLRHGCDDNLFIRSQTGREYWITAYHVVEAGLNPSLVS